MNFQQIDRVNELRERLSKISGKIDRVKTAKSFRDATIFLMETDFHDSISPYLHGVLVDQLERAYAPKIAAVHAELRKLGVTAS